MDMVKACSKYDYIEKLQKLYSSNEFYVRLLQPQGRSDYWNQSIDPDGIVRDIFKEYDLWKENNRELINQCQSIIMSNEIECVLDFGSGPGYLILSLLDHHRSKLRLFAVEPSLLAQEHLQKKGVEVHRSVNELVNQKFDFIIANHVIEHLFEPEQTLELLIDLLKPGGKILIGTPDFLSPSALFFRERYRMLFEPTHISLFSLDSLLRLTRYLGLEVEEVQMPFWDSPYFQQKTFEKVLNHSNEKVSPAFPGNFILVTARKK